jgi:hypothetical protein
VVKKRRLASQRDAPEGVVSLNASLRAYLDAARVGGLDEAVISKVISDLDAVRAYANGASDAVGFSAELWETLVSLVVDHTQRLAAAYSVEIDEPLTTPDDNTVVEMRRHLEAQWRILAQAA